MLTKNKSGSFKYMPYVRAGLNIQLLHGQSIPPKSE